MKPEFRIKEYPKGFVVEYYRKTLFGGKWIHYISVAGIDDQPWYYSSFEMALDDMAIIIQRWTVRNSRN